jgi:plastocyanin
VTVRRWIALAALSLALVGGAACGNAEESDPTPVQTFKITPAATRSPSAPATEPAAETATVPAGETATEPIEETATAPSGEGTTLEVVGLNTLFDVQELTAPAGTITVVFDNRDGGIVHNIHFYRGTDATGEDIAATELEPGPVVQELTMELEPGEYFYVCDAHPATMTGILTVT